MPVLPPLGDLPLEAWAQNASARVTATPTVWGVTAGFATEYAGLLADYSAKLATALTPATRTKTNIAAKNTSKIALRAKSSALIRYVDATATVTPAQRIDLGLNPRDVTPTPIPPPATKPLLSVGAQGVLDLVDELTPSRRAKPAGTRGAVVYFKLQAADDPAPLPEDITAFCMLATKSRVPLPLPTDSDAKKLYVLARWFNERGELGPASAMVSTTIAA